MKVCIHRGSQQIGGSCVEVMSDGQRILLDLGLPLDAEEASPDLLPQVSGFDGDDPSLRAILLSHSHRDHWGLIPFVSPDIRLIMGAATERMMRAASMFVPGGFGPTAARHLVDRESFAIGPFQITPFLVDHSGYDAYALLMEADGKRLFYSGDLRGHGRKSSLFEKLLRVPPSNVDLMLMEGSSLGRLRQGQSFPTERDLEQEFVDLFSETPGMALVACSAQNIDRVVTVYRAAKRTGRQLLVDAYAAEVLRATERKRIPRPADDWDDVKVYIPYRQRVMLKRSGHASIVDAYRGRRLWPGELRDQRSKSVMLLRTWMLEDLAHNDALDGASVVWSQWDGYLEEGSGKRLVELCAEIRLPFSKIHTSGHASIGDLQRLAKAVAPRRLMPIHTFNPDMYPDLFNNVISSTDGKWEEV